MERPNKELEDDFKKLGVYIQDKKDELPNDINVLGVHVEIGFPLDTDIGAPDFDIMVMNDRGTKTYFTAFRVQDRNDQRLFMFETYQEVPSNIPLSGNYEALYFTSYLDLCWKLGNNKIDETVIPSVVTEPQKGASHIDLGWVLPSRFVDSVTNALGMLNVTILSNTMVEALVYGPFYKYRSEEKPNETNA